eukprot:Phypoly_transcript_00492.p1 GENE.Phypoly_transcript_00492~~Phypoly_transcript_00492.p1  ORF type:complete len:1513 (+),score=402.57 Phypoly_transcript_00492:101-4639(+)
MEQPIPLISVGKDGKFQVEKAALDILKKINGKIGVVTVAGLYRTGKSYILNRLLNRQSGFEIGSTVNSQTKGIYIWGTPIDVKHNGENMKVILVDTEGIGSVEKDETHDSQIFALSILLSSYFVYNSFGVIDENALDKLSFITQLSHHIQAKSGDRSEIFPSFLWLLRDFTLELVDFNGKPISSRQYLENALSPVQDKSGNDRNKTKNEIRKTIAQFFRDRDCVTLVRPTVNEKDLRHIDKLPYKELRPEFQKEVEELRKKVLESVEFKTIMGRKLNGEEFGIMCKSYVDAINKGAVPDLKSAWENIGMIENPRAVEEAFKQYLATMKASMDKAGLPMPNESLEALHRSADDEALLNFQAHKIGDSVESYIKELKKRNYEEFLKYQSANQEKAVQACRAIFEKLSQSVEEKVTKASYKDVTDLLHDLDALQTSYTNTAKQQKITLTSAQAEFCNLAPRFWNSALTRTTKYLLREQEQKFTKLQTQLTELQKTYDQVRTDKEAALVEKVRLESQKVMLEKEVSTLNASIKDLQQKLSQLASEKSSLEADIKKGAAERAALEKRAQEEKEAHATTLKDLKKQSKAEKETLAASHDQTRKDLEARIAKLSAEKDDYKTQIGKLEAEKEAVQRAMQDRVAKTEQERETGEKRHRKERESLGMDLNKEKRERETLAAEYKSAKEKLTGELEKISRDKESAEKMVAELRSEIKTQKKEASSNAEKLQSKVEELQKKLDAETEARRKDIEEKESASKKVASLSNSMKKDTTELRNKLDMEEEAKKKLREEMDTTVKTLEAKHKGVEKELKDLRKKLEESEAEIKKVREEKDEVTENLAAKTKEAKKLQKELTAEKSQFSEITTKQAESEKAKKELEKSTRDYESKLETLKEENGELKKRIDTLSERLDQLSGELKTEKSRKLVSGTLKSNTNNNNNNNKNNKKQKTPRPPKVPRPENKVPENKISRKDTGRTKQRVAVLFGYLGTGYYGLQWDDKGQFPTIEKDLEEAIFKMGGILETNHGNLDRVQWARGSRTDKGVHALGNVISLFMELAPDAFNGDKLGLKIADQINQYLPPAIRVFSVIRVTRKFSPREQCAIRTYNLIWPRKYIDESTYNLEALGQLMKQYEGHHDFHNFTRAQHCYRPVPPPIVISSTSTPNPTPDASATLPTDSSPSTATTTLNPTPATSTPSTTPTESSSSTSDSSATPAELQDEKKYDESDDDEVGDDLGGEAGRDKPAQKQSKPRGQKAPAKREDQITYYVHHNSYSRRMLYVGPETSFQLGGEEWIPFKFVGESFAYNQIRKMLGFILHISHHHVPAESLPMALKSPFKINVPMTPGQSLYLLGGTYLDRHYHLIDMFDFLPEGELASGEKFDRNSKSLRWHHLLETSSTSTALGAIVLQRMKDFRDNVLHPHIYSLYQSSNFFQEFLDGIKQERFTIPDFPQAQALFEVWEKQEKERKEKKRQRNAEREEALLQTLGVESKIAKKDTKEDIKEDIKKEIEVKSEEKEIKREETAAST